MNHSQTIAIISPEFPPLTNWGGVATFNHSLAQLLAQLGFEIHVISFNSSGKTQRQRILPNVTLHLIGLKTQNRFFNFGYFRILRPLVSFFFRQLPQSFFILEWNLFVGLYFWKLHQQKKFLTIHSPAYYAPSILVKLFFPQLKLIVHLHSSQTQLNKFFPPSSDLKMIEKIEQWFVSQLADNVISCNRELVETSVSLHNQSKPIFIPNFIDATNQSPLTKKFNPNTLIFWGRLENRKGVEPLILAFIKLRSQNPKLSLWLIGDDSRGLKFKHQFLSLHQFLDQLHLPPEYRRSIHYLPRIDDRARLFQLVKTLAGICIFPSIHEPFGLVYLESMNLGMVTVGSNQGEVPNIIDHEVNGWICPATPRDLAKTIISIQNTPRQKIQSIRKAAQKKIQTHYSLEAVKSRYSQFYHQLA